jgi:hypothetical protein
VTQKFAGFLGGDNNIKQKCPFASGGIDMFNSAIIDVAIGMVLTFLAVSLAASAITEAISSFMKLREKTLLKGIQDLRTTKTSRVSRAISTIMRSSTHWPPARPR